MKEPSIKIDILNAIYLSCCLGFLHSDEDTLLASCIPCIYYLSLREGDIFDILYVLIQERELE